MSTKVKARKPPHHFWETAAEGYFKGGQLKPIMIALNPKFVEIKLKGTRDVYSVPWSVILTMGVKMKVAAEKK